MTRTFRTIHTRNGQMKNRIRLLIVDDHPIVRRGISMCLSHREQMEVVGEAADGREAIRLTREIQPDIVLMDIDMPQMNGLVVTEVLHRELPKVKVLILSMHGNTDYVLRIIQSLSLIHISEPTRQAEIS